MKMVKSFFCLAFLASLSFAQVSEGSDVASVQDPATVDTVKKEGLLSKWGKKALNYASENPDKVASTAVAVGCVAANVIKDGCDRYDILIEYHLMHLCINNCGNAEKCAASIAAWENKHVAQDRAKAQFNNGSCPIGY